MKTFFRGRKCVVDNVVFRLHYQLTLIILVAFSIAVSGSQFVGNPIECISKDDIPENLLKTFCWISTTFSLKSAWHKEVGKVVVYPGVDKHVEGEDEEDKVYHAYYQWVCFVLFLQGLMFYVPHYVWKNTEARQMDNLAMDFNSPVVSAERSEEDIENNRPNDKTKLLVDYLQNNLGHHTFYGSMFVFCEILNFVNVLGQIYLIDTFLGGEFTTYGSEVLAFTEWDYTLRYDPMLKVFPRMSKCTFYRYGSSGDVQKHDALCLISINILNEKIYVFLWFYFVLLTILSGLALLYRAAIIIIPRFRYYLLFSRCRRVNPDDLQTVLSKCDRDDWLVLSFLCKNVRSGNFNVVIRELARQLMDHKSM